jgi:hypothetical protein
VRASIDPPFTAGINKYTQTVAGFGRTLPPVLADGEQSHTKISSRNRRRK